MMHSSRYFLGTFPKPFSFLVLNPPVGTLKTVVTVQLQFFLVAPAVVLVQTSISCGIALIQKKLYSLTRMRYVAGKAQRSNSHQPKYHSCHHMKNKKDGESGLY